MTVKLGHLVRPVSKTWSSSHLCHVPGLQDSYIGAVGQVQILLHYLDWAISPP